MRETNIVLIIKTNFYGKDKSKKDGYYRRDQVNR